MLLTTIICVLTVIHAGWLIIAVTNQAHRSARAGERVANAPAPIGDPERVWRERDARRGR